MPEERENYQILKEEQMNTKILSVVDYLLGRCGFSTKMEVDRNKNYI